MMRIKNPKFLLVLPPLQFRTEELIRPDGSLGLAYIDSALSNAGFHSQILDMSIGANADRLEDTFYRKINISPSLVRIGMSAERILEEASNFDVIALSSIFTQQTSRCFEIGNLIKNKFPEKILVAGGGNARVLREHFFNNGFDVVFLSEGEKAIVNFARYLEDGNPDISEIDGIAFKNNDKLIVNQVKEIVTNLDDIPVPSWEKLPNQQYWKIKRLWGGIDGIKVDKNDIRYACMFTSRGCPLRCMYCHISKEQKTDEAGKIGLYRVHSIERLEKELNKLKDLGVNYIYINDDAFLANRKRVFAILNLLKKYHFKLSDVNGINIRHLFKMDKDRYVVDEELLYALFDSGFRKISLAFESGTQRILDKYCSRKWDIAKCDTADLIRKLNKIGIPADGNFMIGFPDETLEELTGTFLSAKRHMEVGLIACQFFIVQPFPGSALYDETIANGQLSKDWSWDEIGWSKDSLFNNLKIDKNILKYCWSLAWKLLNKDTRIKEFAVQLAGN